MIKKTALFLLLFTFFITTCKAADATEALSTDTSKTIVQRIESWYENNMSYGSITLLMTMESTFLPMPSEIVIPPAAYIASKPDGHLNIFLVVLFGTLGAILGSCINYFLAIWLGRPIMYRLADSKAGKLLFLNSDKIKHAEVYFNKHGKASTFFGRLIPGIRHLISLPAGLARMNFVSFLTYTALGAGIWNIVLALLGYIAHGQADMINKYSHELSIITVSLVGLVIAFFVIRFILKRKKKQ
jgi:membrane protein DedA with SNARE-associated domain